MKWRPPGARGVLDLRSVRVNDEWDVYQQFRRDHAQRRLDASATADHQPEELEAQAPAA